MASAVWEALAAWEVGVALEVAQQEGDSRRFESSLTVVNVFLEQGAVACKFGDFGIKELALLLPPSVANDLGIGLPVG